MYAGRNYGNVNVSKAAGGYWKAEEDIREYATLYSPLSDYREWENIIYTLSMSLCMCIHCIIIVICGLLLFIFLLANHYLCMLYVKGHKSPMGWAML